MNESSVLKKIKKTLDAAQLAGDIEIDCDGIRSKTNFIYDSGHYE